MVDESLRARLGDAALALVTAAGYQGAGTAEFLVDDRGDFYFLEVNARLQVEHPVTEMVTGRDLVADQLAIAQGEHLATAQSQVRMSGHAIEARLYAEDARSGFLPAVGEILDVHWPDIDDLRVDAGVGTGDVVGTRYDPLLAKLITYGEERRAVLSNMANALDATRVLGVTTNRGFLRWLVAQADVEAGLTNTELIDERWHPASGLPEEAWPAAAAALATGIAAETAGRPGFRLNGPARLRVRIGDEERSVAVRPHGGAAHSTWLASDHGSVVLDIDGEAVRAQLAPPPSVDAAVRQAGHHGQAAQHVTAPMPGSVLAIRVKPGEVVEAGQVLLVLEAMKMENGVPAPGAGQVARILVAPGAQVQRGETLIELA